MKLKEALKRIEELELRIRLLETRPAQEHHYHYWYTQPHYINTPLPWQPTWTVSSGSAITGMLPQNG